MNIDLTKSEIELVVNMMDVAVKTVGLQAVKPEVLNVLMKFTVAVQEANKPPKEE